MSSAEKARIKEAKARVSEIQDQIRGAHDEVASMPPLQRQELQARFERAEAEGRYILGGGPTDNVMLYLSQIALHGRP